MIPIRDKNPSGIVPWVVYGLIAINTVTFLVEIGLPAEQLQDLIGAHGLVPQRVTRALKGEEGIAGALILPALTSMFLHGGWLHLIGNMWFLHIFGDNVEGRLGHALFLVYYLVCGLAASGAQYLLGAQSPLPIIGASGAIAGVLGAYIVCWPRARVVTLVPLFFVITFLELPAVLVLGMWFFMQLFQGVASVGASYAHGGVAYFAHVGGFVAGYVLIKILAPPRRPRVVVRSVPGRRDSSRR